MKTVTDLIRELIALLLLVAVLFNCANIVGRYVFLHPFASAEEIILFLLVGVVFLGNSVVAFEGRQLRMDVFLIMLPAKARFGLETLAEVVAIAVSVTIIVVGWPVVSMLIEFDQRSQAADIPLAIPQALIPIGLGLTAVLLCVRISRRLRAREWAAGPIQRDGLH
jgi:TRAP-type C4-dicarboxylate transport system permease small subunit